MGEAGRQDGPAYGGVGQRVQDGAKARCEFFRMLRYGRRADGPRRGIELRRRGVSVGCSKRGE